MKKKILIINHSLQQGGIVRSLLAALDVIDPEKYEITVYSHRDQLDLASLLPAHVELIVNHDKNHYYRLPAAVFLQAKSRMYRLMGKVNKADEAVQELNAFIRAKKARHPQKDYFKDRAFDVVISYCTDFCIEIALQIPARKHYTFFHSSKADFHRDITEICFPKYDKIVAVSPGVLDVLLQGFPSLHDKIDCLSNYMDAQRIRELAGSESVYSAPKNVLRICSCGRLNEEKGFDLAVEAAKLLLKKGTTFIWYFVGDGDMRQKLEEMISAYGLKNNIRITGFLENPYPYTRDCDIYVQPSYQEAQPLAVMEAQILGRPIVSTNTVGGKTILENGKKGVLTDFSGESLADGILSLINDPEKRAAFSNLYTPEDDRRNRSIYAEKWDALLNE